jgi:hypothetical protein
MVPAKQQQLEQQQQQQQQQHFSEQDRLLHDASIARRWAEGVIDSVLQQAACSASDISFAAAAEAAAKATASVAEAAAAAAAMSTVDESSKSLPPSLSASDIQTTHPTATPVIRSAAAAPEIGS